MGAKSVYAILGFVLIIIGMLSLILMVVGVQLSFLTWIDALGRLGGFLIRLLMIIGGFVIITLSQTDWRNVEDD
jgi:uncharacterized Tic20 family protein